MGSRKDHSMSNGTERRLAWGLCAAVLVAGALEQFGRNRPSAAIFAPNWLAMAAGALGGAATFALNNRARWPRLRRAVLWAGLLLMLWTANGLMFDWLRAVRLIPLPVDWPGLVTRTLAFSATLVLAHLILAHEEVSASTRVPSWYGYVAFALALPYPVLRVSWALGGTLGLGWVGAAGKGWAPCLIAIPWVMAAALSLLLVPTWRWMPRRLLLLAGWTATTIVCMIGPAAVWAIVKVWWKGGGTGPSGIAGWVFGLFYGSWFLWGIAAAATTRSYQLRSAALQMRLAEESKAGAVHAGR